ncbi:MAG: 2-oxoglutarate dehydrogenase complex dihydrolipoyllysine-residue succinyltransferase [Desulfobacteraceae bacterium]|nr:2-oxoglutarate dehydrogenase complex dihydrolipoyllysine-residue succinyltransferase [Desulfobacteraceae bacterium]
MEIEIKIPSVGESVQEAVLVQWYKKDGDPVQKDEPIFVVETDKVTLEIVAEASGILKILVSEGETVSIGTKVGSIATEAIPSPEPAPPEKVVEAPLPSPEAAEAPAPVKAKEVPVKAEEAPAKDEEAPVTPEPEDLRPILSPAVRRLVAEKNIDISGIKGTGPGSRITKGDVLLYLEQAPSAAPVPSPAPPKIKDAAPVAPEPLAKPIPSRMEDITRKPMSPMRRTIASRLLEAKHSTAMLTTFNEIDMTHTMAIRTQFKEAFKEKYGVSLGFMSFFIKASVEALKEFPEINAFVDGNDIVYHNYYNVGIAIGTGKGLVVPVIRNADMLSFAELEQAIVDFVDKIKNNRLELADLEGGTFTITNGGVFGSLLSTPILNTPQSGILGMHKIEKRPVVVDDEINIRPMMYVALSYDHRIVDGREAVTFLVRIKECIENPERIMMEI